MVALVVYVARLIGREVMLLANGDILMLWAEVGKGVTERNMNAGGM